LAEELIRCEIMTNYVKIDEGVWTGDIWTGDKFEQAASLIDMDQVTVTSTPSSKILLSDKIVGKVIHCYQQRQHPDLNQNNT